MGRAPLSLAPFEILSGARGQTAPAGVRGDRRGQGRMGNLPILGFPASRVSIDGQAPNFFSSHFSSQ